MTRISEAAQWLVTTPDQQKPHPVIGYLREAFGLSLREAIEAIQEANAIRSRGR